MKYWRGYLTAAVLGFFTWALMQFAKTHTDLVDLFYPYVTRLIQTSLAQWSGGTQEILWQLALVLLVVVVLTTVVLMIVLRWNPIQWFGWILALASVVGLLHTGVYGLNDYAGPLADDIKLERTDATVAELEQAALYYRDLANDLADRISRNNDGSVNFPSFQELADMTVEGFQQMTYHEHQPIFYGTTLAEDKVNWTEWKALPIKELGWDDYFISVGTTLIHMPITGEVAVNPQTPAIAQPFIMCQGVANRLCIANEGDAAFAAYLACDANSSMAFQYSAQFMAYRACRQELAGLPGNLAKTALENVTSGESRNLTKDLEDFEQFFADCRDEEAISRLESVSNFLDDLSYNVRDILGVEKLSVETDSFQDLLVSWHIQEIWLPTHLPEEEENPFDPYNENYIAGLEDLNGNPVTEPPADPTEGGDAE
ncbi:MAG: DUF3810 family protein [Oscillospiraceae bacterium]|nr:DUF3810 family protein [Oscillospiraceae bacterium]